MSTRRLPALTIIGRPNVGKSTLFNRLFGRKRALVHDMPGVTRDRLVEKVDWKMGGESFPILLVDTGGLGGEAFGEEIARQVSLAVAETDVILVCFDAQAGLLPADQEILQQLHVELRNSDRKKIVIGVVNKVDVEAHEEKVSEFYETGLEQILSISAEHGRGSDDLKQAIKEALVATGNFEATPIATEDSDPLPEADSADPLPDSADSKQQTDRIPRIAIVGRPNVGKSTLTNAILKEERMITSPIAGTTIDAVDSPAYLGTQPIILIDTAGIRRKNKTKQGVEVLSVIQAKKALERCDIAILLLDAEEGITDQDEKIGGMIEEVGCSVIVIMNKWDLIQKQKSGFTRDMAAERIRKEMAFLRYAPILFTSAIKGRGFEDLGDIVRDILEQRRVKVATHEFTEWVRAESAIHNPKNAKFYMSHQTGRNPPTFVCHVSDPDKVHFSLRRHLVNAMREKWGYMGSPLRLVFVKVKNRNDIGIERR
ncbi:ribosome biogenesis GTPase Der [bacterium]|nr:ribosome biogenesis GTPase Der [bacterium]